MDLEILRAALLESDHEKGYAFYRQFVQTCTEEDIQFLVEFRGSRGELLEKLFEINAPVAQRQSSGL